MSFEGKVWGDSAIFEGNNVIGVLDPDGKNLLLPLVKKQEGSLLHLSGVHVSHQHADNKTYQLLSFHEINLLKRKTTNKQSSGGSTGRRTPGGLPEDGRPDQDEIDEEEKKRNELEQDALDT